MGVPISQKSGFLRRPKRQIWFEIYWVNIKSTGRFHPVHQTWYFKLENCKTQVQIDKVLSKKTSGYHNTFGPNCLGSLILYRKQDESIPNINQIW